MAQTMRELVKARVIHCVNTLKEHPEYVTFDNYYHETIFDMFCQKLKEKNLNAYVKYNYGGIFDGKYKDGSIEVRIDFGSRNSSCAQLKISSLMHISNRVTPEIAEDYFPKRDPLFNWTLTNENREFEIETDVDLPVDDYFTEALEICYQTVEYELQLTLDAMRRLLNAKEALLQVDSIRNADYEADD